MPFATTTYCFPTSLPPKQPRAPGGLNQNMNPPEMRANGGNGNSSGRDANGAHNNSQSQSRINNNNNNHHNTPDQMNINNNLKDKKGVKKGKDTGGTASGVTGIIQTARNNYCKRRSNSKGRCGVGTGSGAGAGSAASASESEECSYRSYNDNFDLLPDGNDNDLLNPNNPATTATTTPSEGDATTARDFDLEEEKIEVYRRPVSLAVALTLTLPRERNIDKKNGNDCSTVPIQLEENFVSKTRRSISCSRPTFTSFLGLASDFGPGALPLTTFGSSGESGSGWLWQKSLSEGNLSIASAVVEDGGEVVASSSYSTAAAATGTGTLEKGTARIGRQGRLRGVNCKSVHAGNQIQQHKQHQEQLEKLLQIAGTQRRNFLSVGDPGDKTNDEEMAMRHKSVPKFFRSISLRNLLQIGGMNKSRPAPAQGKRVSPPTAPLVSFPSFRVKKSQQHQQQQQQQQQESFELQSKQQEKEQQRYSGSSLGSAGSSYASSGSSGGSDNRSSIGIDDGFIVSSGVYSNGYLKDLEEYHPSSQGIHLKNSNSFDSFASSSTCAPATHSSSDMHQGIYGKLGGSSNSNNSGNSNNGPGSTGPPSPHVTVHVDPHPHPHSGTLQHQHLHQQHGGIGGGANNVFSPSSQPMTSHYQTQISLEDQGIDMTQSPGRESPSSTASSNTGSGSGSAIGSVGSGSGSNGCRHSTASFDSGRASSTIYQGVRYSGLSSESSSGSFRHSYHSSSSSLGSIPPEEICNFDVAAMIAQGIPDHEVLNAWLTGIHFECYYQNFIQAGYDMHTISRMTPEDLNAIGVTKPHHRKRLKSEISQLNISDGLPEYIPGSIEEWLGLLKLEEYNTKLRGQGYHSVRQVTNITWEDLEDIGILKLGHQKKFMLAIKRVEDILAGKRIPTANTPNAYLTPLDSFPSQQHRPMPNTSAPNPSSMGMPYSHPNQNIPNASTAQYHHHTASFPRGLTPQQHQHQQNLWRQASQNSSSNNSSSMYSTGMQMQLHTHQPQIHNMQNQSQAPTHNAVPQPQYHPEVISIHVKNGRRKSLDNPDEEPIYGTSSFLPNPASTASSTSTLPRLVKNKSISKIMSGVASSEAGSNYTSNPTQVQQQQQQPPQVPQYGDGYKSLPRDIGRLSKSGSGFGVYHQQSNYNTAGGTGTLGKNSGYGTTKNGPPPPPRRGSCSAEPMQGHFSTFQQQQGNSIYSGVSGSWANLPPPPPTLSCDAQYSCSPAKSIEEFPPPPHPDDLVMMSPQSVQSSSSKSATSSTSTSSSTSPNNPPQPLKISSASNGQQNYHSSNNNNYHSSNISSNAGGGVMRNSPPHSKSRDPSPVGSDFSDSDLPSNNGLLSRGVRRNGSDASFKSNSSTESESIPFANDNAGTIKQQKPSGRTQHMVSSSTQPTSPANQGTGDVLNDIGNMLADLTDELDAILEQEMSSKR